MLEALRATGRTNRLIEEAKRLHEQGKLVVVVASTAKQANEITAKTENVIQVIHSQLPDWDWNEMRQYGRPFETEYLIDHYAIEKKYAKVLQALHRFDPPVINVC